MLCNTVLLKDNKADPDKVDLILHNTQLKKLIIKRMRDYKINPLRLMASTQVRYDELRIWLVTESVNTKPLSHYQILRICNMLKIKIRVQLIVEDSDVDQGITSKFRYDRNRSEKVTAKNNSEVGEQLGKITGINASSFGIDRYDGIIDPRGDGNRNESKVSEGNKTLAEGTEGAGGNDKGVQAWRKGNMATRYEIE